ncbi:MAG: S-layer homology domain-containing protein [Abitibacteriaceae bacterium]|nr:S-layer homology domain-containing protein [Abditibacteriaceae bacterium]
MKKKRGFNLLKVFSTTLLITAPLVRVAPAHAGANNAGIPSVVRIPRGGRITLPLEDVTRVVPDDDDIARGSFVNGKAVLEGVTNGDTQVEVYQKNNQRRLLTVRVQEASDITGDTAQTQAVGTQESTTTAPIPNLPAAPDASGGPSFTGASGGTSATNQVQPTSASITPANPRTSSLFVSLGVNAAEDNPSQALFTVTFGNKGNDSTQNVKVHYALDDMVSYVPNSATGDAHYDAAARELVWNVGVLAPNSTNQKVSFRVQPIDKPATFYSVATIEDATGVSVSSNTIKYFPSVAPLMTVFALPDRFLAGRNAPVLVDVKGVEFQTAIDRLQKMGVISGVQPGIFQPARSTQRAEYAVMTLNGLNIRDLRDLTAIKFVLGRRSTVTLNILNSQGKIVAPLVKNTVYEPGERTVVWDGRSGTGYAPPGRYTYSCTAKDATGETMTLKGFITIVPQTPLEPAGKPSFVDIHPSDWYAGYLALAEKQALIQGYPDKTFRPERTISRVEATAIVVRALGMEDAARQLKSQDAGFLDYHDIPDWAVGYVNAAATMAKTANGKLIVGYPSNFFLPMRALRRDEAALIVQRLIDKATDRTIRITGQLAPGATVSIDGVNVQPADDGRFEIEVKQNSAQPTTVAVTSQQR